MTNDASSRAGSVEPNAGRLRSRAVRVRCRGIWFALLVAFIPAKALAETPARTSVASDSSRRAAARYEEGVSAYAAGHYKDAIDCFRDADALAPRPALSYNSALAYDKLLDAVNALANYREYLRREPAAGRAEAVSQRIRELEAVLARRGIQQVTLHSDPSGATVVVDDKPLGVTPWAGALEPGSHQVELRLPGYADFTQRMSLSREHAVTLAFKLARVGQATVRAVQPVPQAALSAAAPPRATSSAIWPWLVVGGGGAALLTAGAFELSRASAVRRAKSETTQIGRDDALSDAEARQTKARVLAGIGGGLTLTGVVLLFVTRSRASESPNAALACDGQGGCFGSWRSAF
jgi:tetratricopeptide (TPR) repeat protein